MEGNRWKKVKKVNSTDRNEHTEYKYTTTSTQPQTMGVPECDINVQSSFFLRFQILSPIPAQVAKVVAKVVAAGPARIGLRQMVVAVASPHSAAAAATAIRDRLDQPNQRQHHPTRVRRQEGVILFLVFGVAVPLVGHVLV